MTIWFDMDGTLADLYGVNTWQTDLDKGNTRPYKIAKPLFSFSAFAKVLHKLQASGKQIGIISWTSKDSTIRFHHRVEKAKIEWLEKHLPSVKFDEIIIAPYGTPKHGYMESSADVLFDDDKANRDAWTGTAYSADRIVETLQTLV